MDKGPSSKDLFRATGIVALLTVLSRVLGLVRDVVIASVFGAGLVTDAYFVAFKVPNLLRRLVAEGSLSSAFVPVFAEELLKSKESAEKTFRAALSFCLLLTIVLTALGVFFSTEITMVFAPGFTKESGKTELAGSLMQLMFPYVIFISLTALCGSVLNAVNRFAVPASAPAILNVVLISSILFFARFFRDPIYCLAIAVTVGGFVGLLPQLILLKKTGFSLVPTSPFSSEPLRQMLKLFFPAVLSASAYQILVFINTLLASMLPDGSVSWLYYADRLYQFPLGIFAMALSTVVLPSLSLAAASGEERMFREQLMTVLRWAAFITIPATAGLIVLSSPMVSAIYVHGSFSSESGMKTAQALCAFSLGLLPLSCQSLLTRAFLARKNPATPFYVSLFTIFLNLGLAVALMGPSTTRSDFFLATFIVSLQNKLSILALGHNGLALAGSVASGCGCLLLIREAAARNLVKPQELALVVLKSAIGAGVVAGLCSLAVQAELPPILTLILCLPSGVAVYFLTMVLIGSNEANQAFSYLKTRSLQLFQNNIQQSSD